MTRSFCDSGRKMEVHVVPGGDWRAVERGRLVVPPAKGSLDFFVDPVADRLHDLGLDDVALGVDRHLDNDWIGQYQEKQIQSHVTATVSDRPRVSSPSKQRVHSKAIGSSPRSAPLTEIQETWRRANFVHLVARDQELSGIQSWISIASKTAAIAYRVSIGSTKPHARTALETSSLSSVFGNSSNPATDSSSSCRTSSNRATLSSAM